MEKSELIEKYLEGSLSDDERAAFEELALSDAEFRKLLEMHKEVNESIGDKEFIELHRLIEKVSAEYMQLNMHTEPVVKTFRFRKTIIQIAALLVLTVASGMIIKSLFTDQVNEEKLYRKYYSTYDSDIISRSVPSETTTLNQAILNYINKAYPESLSLLNDLVQQDEKNYSAWFYRGLACLETDQTGEAIRSFNAIPESWDSPYLEHRNWYLALSLLRNGDIADASRIFMTISTTDGYYAREAEKLNLKLTD